MKSRFYLLLPFLFAALNVLPQSSSQKAAVLVSADVQSAPPRITLNWEAMANTSSISIHRKLKSETNWIQIATPSSSSTSYQDNSVQVGVAYEYKLVRSASGSTGTGYILSGIEVPSPDFRGKMILLVDNTLAPQMSSELSQLEYDLKADGWTVLRSDVSRTASASSIRNIVTGHYNSDPQNVKAVYIVGHVPVPYSGNQAPDGHGEHVGAWPCDGYYGEMNGNWTDNSVYNNGSQRAANRNIPGDGKFDQNDYPSSIELQVGRVDLYDMPAFPQSEVQLVKNYLNRAHNFKVKNWAPLMRGMVFDNLQWVSNPLAGSGWRNMGPLVGADQITSPYSSGPAFHSLVNGESYLWTYSSGGGEQEWIGGEPTFNGANNIGNTYNYANNSSMGGVFNLSCGSYFGDWDNKNNFLRAPLAKGDALTSVWSGIPAYYFHHMGLGENIGYSVRATMNNTGLYSPITEGWQGSIGRAHLGLQGDPSLRMQMVAPPTSLTVSNAGGIASFSWSASSESNLLGYHIYKFNTNGTITRLTTSPVSGTSHQNPAIPFEAGREYMVRAVKLQVNESGSYHNLSLGSIATAAGSAVADCQGVVGGGAVAGAPCNDGNPCTINDTWNSNCQCSGTATTVSASITPAGPTSFCAGGSVVLNANTGSGLSYTWRRDGQTISGANSSSYTATLAGNYTVRVSNGGCEATSSAVNVSINTSPSASITAAGPTSFCAGGSVVLNANTGSGLSYTWRRDGQTISGASGNSYTATLAGNYTVRVSNGGCEATSSAVNVSINTSPSASITPAGPTSFCAGGSVVLNANTGSGLSYVWRRDGQTISGASGNSYTATLAGNYTVRVSNGGCEATSSGVNVSINTSPSASITAAGPTSFCAGGSVVLNANTGSGLSYVWRRDGQTISGASGNSYTATLVGSYTVRVSNGGCEATSSAVNVSINPAPSASITAAGPTSFCAGGSVVLNANTGSGLSYTWRRDGQTISGANSSSYTATLAGNYTVRVSNGGCEATSSGVNVSISTSPSASITPAGPTSFCAGGSVVLNANTGSGLSYTWRRDGQTISGASGNSYTATLAGNYTVRVSNGGCEATSSGVNVSINPAPSASITAAGPTSFCAGGSVVLNANTGSGLSYTWRRDGQTISGASGNSYTATLAGNYTVRVSNGGCEATSSAVNVSINPAPSASITTSGDTDLCTGGNVVLNANTGSGLSYVWRRNGNVVQGETNSSITATLSGNYTVVVSNANCSTTSAPVPVTISSGPNAILTPIGSTQLCEGGSVLLTTNNGAGLSYVWKRNGQTIVGASGWTYDADQAGNYTVTVSNSDCSATSAVVAVTMMELEMPVIGASGPTTICEGDSVTLTVEGGANGNFIWTLDGMPIATIGASITVSAPGTYGVQISGNGCLSSVTTVEVSVVAAPLVEITVNGPSVSCGSDPVTLQATTHGDAEHIWMLDGAVIEGENGSAIEAEVSGSYSVALANGCAATSDPVSIVILETPQINCYHDMAAGIVGVEVIGGQAPFTYTWNGEAADTSFIPVAASGQYEVVVTDANGCSEICTVDVILGTVNDPCAGIRTETQMTWSGSDLMLDGFTGAFPDGLTIGCGFRELTLTNGEAVAEFLPSSGPAQRLPFGTMVDPGNSYGNSLAGELVALKLSVRFDELDEDFSNSDMLLKDAMVANGIFAGMTVSEVIEEADKRIGGCFSWFSRNQLRIIIQQINLGYAGGEIADGTLLCTSELPQNEAEQLPELDDEHIDQEPTADLEFTAYPNPFTDNTTIVVGGLMHREKVTVDILSAEGLMLERIYEGDVMPDAELRLTWNASDRAKGVYFYRVTRNSESRTGRLVLQ